MKYLPSLPLRLWLTLLLAAFLSVQSVRAFNHPGIPLTKDDLDYVKARLNVQPWLAGWNALQADPHASLSYVMQGPYTTVSRTPNINQGQWKNDMDAVYKLSLRWYYSGDQSYAAKATAIWEAWITTQTSYGGSEAYLDIGDYAYAICGGPDILRGTYPGWTAQNTTDSINYLTNIIKPTLFGAPPLPVRGANQGMAQIMSAMGIAAFCDDTTYWNQCLFAYRNDGDGLLDTSAMGMVGDTGRDWGHWQDQFLHYAWGSAVAWAQGVDLFSELDNRLAKCAEYASRFSQGSIPPYVAFGGIYALYPTLYSPPSNGLDLGYRSIILTAYETRKGLSLPWTDQMTARWGGGAGFQFYRQADSSTATYSPLTPLTVPALATAGAWTDADIGSPGQAGSSNYSNGTWTVQGGGANVYSTAGSSDQFHFAYKAMSGDFVIVARVSSLSPAGASAKAGLMVRDSLSPTANVADVYMTPTTVEAEVRGALGESHGDLNRTFAQTMPYWVKVERRGEWLGRYIAPDGINWQPINYAQMGSTMNAGATVYVGLMACANDDTKLTTATFDNVAISGAIGVAPATPTNFVAMSGQGQTMLSWIAGAGSTACNVKRATTSGGPYTTIAANLPATTYTDLDLANGTMYYYVVSGTNDVGESANSTESSASPSASAPVPAAPSGVTAFASDGRVDLTWSAVAGATSYTVKRATSSSGPYSRLFFGGSQANTSFSDLTASDGTTYYYIVDTVNAYGESAPSTPAVGTPQATLVWTGVANGTWDLSTSANWSSNGSSTVYTDGSPVQFDDTAFTTTVTPAATMAPASVLINNSTTNYTFTATGIGGTATVVKRGPGALTFQAAQPFSGGMNVNDACTINFYNGATLGTGTVNINANTDFFATSNGGNWAGILGNNIYIGDSATLTYRGDWKVAFNGNFAGTGTLSILPGGHATSVSISGNNSGFSGTINVGGSQVLLLNSANAGSANAIWNLTAGGNRLAGNVSNGTFYLGELTNNTGVIGQIFNNITSSNTATFILGDDNTENTPIFNGAFVDNGGGKLAITKVGSNIQSIVGANTYSGPTNVNAGGLIVTTHATGAGSYTLASGSVLGVINQVDGTSLNVSTLTLAAGSELDFSNVQSTTVPVISAANVTLGGTCIVDLLDAVYLTNGATYPLIHYTGAFTGSVANFQVVLPTGWSGTLANSGNQIVLAVTGPTPANQGWTGGAGSGAWSASSNWGGSTLNSGDYLTFGTTSGTTALVNDRNDFIAGSLTFSATASSYTISGNELQLDGDITNNSSVAQTFALPMTLLRSINIVTNTGAVTLSGAIDTNVSGWGITKLGTGTLVMSGANTFTGGVNLSAGTLEVAGTGTSLVGPLGTGAGALTLSGGTLQYGSGATLYNNVISQAGTNTAINEVNAGNTLFLRGNISGAGILTFTSTFNYGGAQLFGDNSGFTGTVVFTGGTSARDKFGSANAGSAAARWVLNGVSDSPSTTSFSGTISLGELSGNSSDVRNDQSGSTVTYSIGALNTDSTWAGTFSNIGAGIIALTKIGTGTLTVSGTNTYIGSTTINGGVLNVTGSLRGSGAVTVNSGATLAGTGSVAGATTVKSGGILAPGSTGGGGALTFSGAVTLNSGSNLTYYLGATSGSDQLALTGSFTPPASGTVSININAVSGFSPGVYTLVTGASGITAGQFSINSTPSGYYGVLSANNGTLSVQIIAGIPPPPPAPQNLTAAPAAGNTLGVALSWATSTTAKSYNVKRATASGGPYSIINSANVTSYNDTAVTGGATYYYILTALNDGGESPNSTEMAFHLVTPVQLTGAIIGSPGSFNNAGNTGAMAFDGNLATFYDAANVTGDWTGLDFGASAGNVITLIQYCPRGTLANRMVGGVFQVSNVADFSSGVVTLFTVTVAPPDGVLTSQYISNTTSYRYARYLGPTNGSCNVAEIVFGGNVVPLAPGSFAATAGNTQITLSWAASGSATSYDVKRATVSGGPYTTAATGVTATSYVDTGLSNGTTYYYVVAAANSNGEGANSVEVSAVPAPVALAVPSGFKAVPGSGQVTLSWNATSDATSYALKRSNVSGGPYTVVASGLTTTSYVDAGLTNGSKYYYVVVGAQNPYQSPNSIEVMGTPGDSSFYWRATPASGNWSLGTNWAGGAAPGAGAALVFGATSTVALTNDITGLSVASLTFASGAPALTISGNAFSLNGGISNNATTTQTINTGVTLGGNCTITTATGSVAAGGIIGDGGAGYGLTKAGAQTLTLNGLNTFSGNVTLSAGTLAIAGVGTGTSGLPTAGALGRGTLQLGGGTLTSSAAATVYNNLVAQSGTATAIVSNTANITLAGNLSGSGTINESGTNTAGAYFSGNNSGFTGAFNSSNATGHRVRFSSATAGSAGATWVLSNAQTDGYGLVMPTGSTVSFGSLSGGGQFRSDSGNNTTVTISVGALNTSSSFSGSFVANGTQVIALTKVGTGILTLSGGNGYTGATNVTAGTLLVNGTFASPVTVTAGTFGGIGTSSAAVTVGTGAGAGAILAPGNQAIGTFTTTGALTLKSDATYAVELNSGSVAADKIIAPSVTLSNAALTLTDLGSATFPVGTTLTIVNNTGGAAVSGTFAGRAEGALIVVGANTFKLSYLGGSSGRDVVLTTTLSAPAVTSASSASGGVGTGFNYAITATNSPTSFTATGLPAGLSVTPATGIISGTPAAAGTFTATIGATNSAGSSTVPLTLTIARGVGSVTLGNLTPTYTGAPLAASATTSPAGLGVSLTYNGSTTAPTAAGSYPVVATITDTNYTGSATGTFVIAKAPATIALGSLAATYDGTAKSVTATTSPSGLTVQFTYNGSSSAPSVAGSYAVVATISAANYTGSASGTLTIAKGSAAITLESLAQTYDGTPKLATATTTPLSLNVTFTYDGDSSAPTTAGSYAVVGTITDPNYTGTASGTLVIGRAAATIALGSLAQTYDGTPKLATATTTPAGLTTLFSYDEVPLAITPAAGSLDAYVAAVGQTLYFNVTGTSDGVVYGANSPGYSIDSDLGTAAVHAGILTPGQTAVLQLSIQADTGTYSGSTQNGVTTQSTTDAEGSFQIVGIATSGFTFGPVAAGSYPVTATILDANYTGSASGALVIAKASTAISWSAPAPITYGTALDDSQLNATASTLGTFAYTPAAGTILNAGANQSLNVAFTPADAVNYETATGATTITVNQAVAPVALSGLAPIYDGSPKSATATTTPAGLRVSLTYDGSATPPTTAGTYAVAATIIDANYLGSASGTLVVAKAPATIALGNLTSTYSGAPISATATTTPASLSVTLAYNGSATPPTNAGSYAVNASIVDPNYFGSSSATLVIGNAASTIALGNLNQTYDGTPKSVTVTTTPSGQAVALTYSGSATAPTNAGSYSLAAKIVSPNYTGSTTGTLIIAKAPAAITLGALAATYDGTPKSATATTAPAGLSVTLTYDGSTTAPTAAGSYAVAATVNNANYTGTASATLVIAKSTTATITLAPLTQRYDGTGKSVTATTDPSGLNVDITYDGATAAPIYPGPHTVVATIGDPNYSVTKTETLVVTTTALVRHAPTVNGIVDGSLQVLLPESVTLNGSASLSGDLLVPGTPTLHLNGSSAFVGTKDGSGSATPIGQVVTLNGGSVLRYLVRRIDAIAMPTVVAPTLPSGTRSVTINNSTDSVGDFATLRNLTLNGDTGSVSVPPGAYGNFTANGGGGFVLGVAGATEPALYSLQNLRLNGNTTLQLAGPVVLTLAGGVSVNGTFGNSAHPDWLTLQVYSGGVTLNGGAAFYGDVIAPSGTTTINGNSALHGTVTADRLTLNGNAVLDDEP